ncbi:MAG: PAS domain S-box protein [Methanolinea sp.]|jgi:PAS domain S-box-containing protein|nr:PAS domain S-box protein [Methanolinea sp.]
MISVLCVDDDASLLDITRIYLEKTGDFTVDTAESAIIALKKIKDNSYDAIVSDYQMPGMDGIAFLTLLRREYPDMPFLIFTGKGRDEVIIRAFERGADFYIQKGGDPRSQFTEMAHKIRTAVLFRKEQKARRESEARFRALIENASDIIRILDENGNIVFDAGSGESLLGYPPGFMVGKNPLEFIHPDDQAVVRAALGEVFLRKNPGTPTDFRVRKADGSYIWVESIAKNLLGVPGIDGIVVNTRSIEEQKRADLAIREREEALKASEENYRRLFEHAAEGILVAQGDRIVHHNPALERILRYPSNVIRESPFVAFIHPDDREMVQTRHTRRMGGQETPTGYLFRIIRGDGQERLLWITSTPMTWSGEPANLSFVTDITDQRDVEKNRNLIGRILENSLNEIYVFDGQTLTFVAVNRGARENLGYSMEELRSMTPWDLKREFSQEKFEEFIAPLRRGEVQELQFYSTHTRKDGSCYPVEVHLQYSGDEVPAVFVAIILDISNRIRTEEELREKDAQYRLIAENSADCIWVANLDLQFTYISPAITKLRGVSVEKALSQRLEDFLTPESLSLVQKVLEEELAIERSGTGDPRRSRVLELEEYLPDGNTIWVSNTLSFLRDGDGRPRAILGISRDITDRKRATEDLEESKQKYNALFDNNYSVAILVDPDTGQIVDANDAAIRFYGYPRDHFLSMGIHDLNHLPREKIVRDLGQARDIRGKHFLSTHFLADGSIRNVEIYSGPITIRGKQLFYSIIHDISARVSAERALRVANRKLQLLSGITRHDILNSITVAQGYIDLMGDPGTLPPETAENVIRTLRRIRRQIEFTREYEDLGLEDPVWQNLGRMFRLLDFPPHVSLHMVYCDWEVYADPMLRKVFENLLENSIRHGGPDMNSVTVTCRESGPDLIVEWQDNGTGISNNEKEAIFSRGYGKGTGFGLFLAREILGISGITIRECGSEGQGARFAMVVPAGQFRPAITMT